MRRSTVTSVVVFNDAFFISGTQEQAWAWGTHHSRPSNRPPLLGQCHIFSSKVALAHRRLRGTRSPDCERESVKTDGQAFEIPRLPQSNHLCSLSLQQENCWSLGNCCHLPSKKRSQYCAWPQVLYLSLQAKVGCWRLLRQSPVSQS